MVKPYQLSLFNMDIYEYAFVLSPDQETEEIVGTLKQKIARTINETSEYSLSSKAHLSLAEWKTSKIMDEMVIEKASEALTSVKGFVVRYGGKEIYRHKTTKSLVLKIENPDPIKEVVKILFKYFPFKSQTNRYHITIVRALPADKFDIIDPQLAEYDHKGGFVCKSVIILRRTVTENGLGAYNRIKEIYFGNSKEPAV